MKDDDFGMNSPLLWLRDTDRGLQSLNFQGIGVNPWMQPRFDPSMLNMQADMYQAVAAAALQDMRSVDPSKQHPGSLHQFQQPLNFANRTAALMQAQMLQHSQQPQQAFQNNLENQHLSQSQPQTQTHPQQHLQHQHSFNNQLHHHNQQQQQPTQQVVDNSQQISGAVSTMSQFVSAAPQLQSPPMQQALSSLCNQQSFSDSNVNSSTTIVSPLHSILGSFPQQDETSHLLSLPRTNSWVPVQNSTGWPSKRVAVDPLLSSGAAQCILPQAEQLGQPQNTISQNAITLPPFPGRECSIDQEGSNDPQSNLLFGVNIDPSSLLMHNGMSNFKGISGGNSDSSTMPYQSSNYMNTAGNDSSLNHGVTSSIGDSGFLRTPENAQQGNNNPLNETFVKVTFRSGIIIIYQIKNFIFIHLGFYLVHFLVTGL